MLMDDQKLDKNLKGMMKGIYDGTIAPARSDGLDVRHRADRCALA
jgi:hypothetical protein